MTKHNLKITRQRNDFARLVHAYIDAAIANSWKGGGDPADAPLIGKELELAALKFQRALDRLFPIERDSQ